MTKPDTTRQSDISDRQSIAIDLLLNGETTTAVAEKIGVTRQTVSNWIHHHLPFIAESKLRRQQRLATTTQRFEKAVSLALDIVIKQLENGDSTHITLLLKHAASHLNASPESSSIPGITADIAQRQYEALLRETTYPAHVIFSIDEQSHAVADTPLAQ